MGYTRNEEHAGKFDLADAVKICRDAKLFGYIGKPPEMMVPELEQPA
jgi:hypothetical protein